jgi:hypothetical protein
LHYPHFLLVGNELSALSLECSTGLGGSIPVLLNSTNAACMSQTSNPLCWRLACPYGGQGGSGLLNAFSIRSSDVGWFVAVMVLIWVLLRAAGWWAMTKINHLKR